MKMRLGTEFSDGALAPRVWRPGFNPQHSKTNNPKNEKTSSSKSIYIVFNHLAKVHKNEETRKNIDEEEEEEGRREQNL